MEIIKVVFKYKDNPIYIHIILVENNVRQISYY
jgi:hypothetical protein